MADRRHARAAAKFEHIRLLSEMLARDLELCLIGGLIADRIIGIFLRQTVPETLVLVRLACIIGLA